MWHKTLVLLLLVHTSKASEIDHQRDNVLGNITDAFTGNWDSAGEQMEKFKFFTKEGLFLLTMTNLESTTPNIDYVEGELSIKDGVYSTDEGLKYLTKGIYFWEYGFLFLLANPGALVPEEDYTISLDNLTKAFEQSTIYPKIIDGSAESIWDIHDISFPKNIFLSESDILYYERFNKSKAVSEDSINDCYFQIWISFKKDVDQSVRQIDNGDFTVNRAFHQFDGYLYSPNCDTWVNITGETLLVEKYYRKTTNYVLVLCVITVIQIFVMIDQLEYTTTQSAAVKISIYTVSLQAILDSYICLAHLTAAVISDRLFNVMAIVSFLKFVLFSVFELRFMLQIWRATHPDAFRDGWQNSQHEITSLYVKFYSVLVVGFIIQYCTYITHTLNIFLLLLYSFWIPQIYHSVKHNSYRPLTIRYIVGMSLTRLFIPLYFEGCPNNFAHSRPDETFSIFITIWVISQAIFVITQDYLGAQFFVPSYFLPKKYDYFRQFHIPRDEKCAVCRGELIDGEDNIITPCNHIYHQQCLRRWLEQKLECPTCRQTLPEPPFHIT